ncbi:MAG: tetratricopeptide repeat protein [Bacteroidota bacterium]|jgi:tetratricopeptide (TPR) repeat protein
MSNKANHQKKEPSRKQPAKGSKDNQLQHIRLFNSKNLLTMLIIAGLTFFVYSGALKNDFVNLDDDRYVTENPKLFLQSTADMFKIPDGYHMGNYHPITMVVYKLIYNKVKLDPFAYHLINLIIHIFNTLLVFYLVFLLSSCFEIACVTALLFGVHTMHVESVAWISELKDLLYAFFFFASLIAYVHYAKDRRRKGLYALAMILFLGSLLSKAMAASLSVVLFAIDFYLDGKFNRKYILEKIPFLALSAVFGIIAIKAQQSMDAVGDYTIFKPHERVALASYGYVTYLWKLIFPVNLSAYYAYPLYENDALPPVYFVFILLVLIVVAASWYSLRKNRYVFFGMAFFSITVFLVLQLLPVGGAVMADRYSYIPSMGIFFIFANGIYLLYKKTSTRYLAYGIILFSTAAYSFATVNRCKIWKDGMTLWSDVIDKSQTIVLAYNNRGVLFNTMGQNLLEEAKKNPVKKDSAVLVLNKALNDFNNALRLNNKDTQAWSNKGLAYWRLGMNDSAIYNLNRAVTIDANYAIAWSNLGSVYYSASRFADAVASYEKAVQCNPSLKDGWYNLGIINYNMGNKEKACESLQKAAALGMEHAGNAFRDLCK